MRGGPVAGPFEPGPQPVGQPVRPVRRVGEPLVHALDQVVAVLRAVADHGPLPGVLHVVEQVLGPLPDRRPGDARRRGRWSGRTTASRCSCGPRPRRVPGSGGPCSSGRTALNSSHLNPTTSRACMPRLWQSRVMAPAKYSQWPRLKSVRKATIGSRAAGRGRRRSGPACRCSSAAGTPRCRLAIWASSGLTYPAGRPAASAARRRGQVAGHVRPAGEGGEGRVDDRRLPAPTGAARRPARPDPPTVYRTGLGQLFRSPDGLVGGAVVELDLVPQGAVDPHPGDAREGEQDAWCRSGSGRRPAGRPWAAGSRRPGWPRTTPWPRRPGAATGRCPRPAWSASGRPAARRGRGTTRRRRVRTEVWLPL